MSVSNCFSRQVVICSTRSMSVSVASLAESAGNRRPASYYSATFMKDKCKFLHYWRALQATQCAVRAREHVVCTCKQQNTRFNMQPSLLMFLSALIRISSKYCMQIINDISLSPFPCSPPSLPLLSHCTQHHQWREMSTRWVSIPAYTCMCVCVTTCKAFIHSHLLAWKVKMKKHTTL